MRNGLLVSTSLFLYQVASGVRGSSRHRVGLPSSGYKMEANGYHKVFSGLKVRYIFLSNYKRFQVNEKCAFVCFGGVEYHSILAVYSNFFASCFTISSSSYSSSAYAIIPCCCHVLCLASRRANTYNSAYRRPSYQDFNHPVAPPKRLMLLLLALSSLLSS